MAPGAQPALVRASAWTVSSEQAGPKYVSWELLVMMQKDKRGPLVCREHGTGKVRKGDRVGVWQIKGTVIRSHHFGPQSAVLWGSIATVPRTMPPAGQAVGGGQLTPWHFHPAG